MKKSLITLATAATLGLSAGSASADYITVGGVTWDPDSVNSYPVLDDFFATGIVFENFAAAVGSAVNGYGKITTLNSSTDNSASFCVGCELTYTFSMVLSNATLLDALTNSYSFSFSDIAISVWVDNTPDFAGTSTSASDGLLWLALAGNGNVTGLGTNILTASATGTGTGLLDVVGGLAADNFDTNTKANGSDMVLSSSFQPLASNPGMLTGNIQLTGNSIPEPGSLALAGLGLLGLASRRRKISK